MLQKTLSKRQAKQSKKEKDETVERSGAGRIVLSSDEDDSSHDTARVCPNNDPILLLSLF